MAMMSRMLMLCAGRKFDIVLCGFGYPTPILAYVVCALTRVPYAVHALGEDLVAARRGSVRRALSIALRKACAVVCISRFTANEAKLLGVPSDTILTISPGIDPAPYFDVSIEDVEALRSPFGLFEKKLFLRSHAWMCERGTIWWCDRFLRSSRLPPMLTTSLLGKAIPQEYLPSRRNLA